ncbi:hypothetical protein [Phyllobacterium zundukense]|uniref:Uncharacterized protein n=1 Tax=Phyllobacterium zundukense TaxID=1867719 RepID=A0ACD4CVJ7_9HYPH|nr:hypothetical protein [Phyllobacterium zundukense]UXN57586.1 hypothetical protein N8E88_04505 [Phyllobacterium zundukense]
MDLEPGFMIDAPSPVGSLHHPATFEFSTIRETVPGAWAEVVVRGDPALETPFVAAAQRLAERGASAITADCGFSIRHQAAVAAAVDVPVAMSALMLVSMILRQLPAEAKLAVLTFDATHCGKELLDISDPSEQARVVIGGLERTQTWENEMKRPPEPTDAAILQQDVCACIEKLRQIHPEIRAILLECTMFPRIAQSVRRYTGLPVYDITTLCRMVMESVTPGGEPD